MAWPMVMGPRQMTHTPGRLARRTRSASGSGSGGIGPIDPDADPREFGAEVPRGEFYWPTHTDSSGQQIHATQQGPPQPRLFTPRPRVL